jgi:hypothetical protein
MTPYGRTLRFSPLSVLALGVVLFPPAKLRAAEWINYSDTSYTARWLGAELFSENAPSAIQIEISSQDLEKLRKESREFVRAQVKEAGTVYLDVAVHLKGSVGSFRPIDDKPAFTLDFARFHTDQRFHGLRRIHLNNSVEDPSYSNEWVGSVLFRRAGLPAPRVGRALVTLNQRRLGLYVLKEGFTEDFLSCYFKTIGGGLYEPGEGHDVNQHLKRSSILEADQSRKALQTLTDAALEPDLNRRWERLAPVLDLDRFIRFMALEVMLGHRDGYCLARNNFRVYQDLDTQKWIFFPQGMDQLFGTAELPWMPSMAGLVAQAVIQIPEGRSRYSSEFKKILDTVLVPEALSNQVNQSIGPLASCLTSLELTAIRMEATSLCRRIAERKRFLQDQLNATPAQSLEFVDNIAPLVHWEQTDRPAQGRMEQGSDSEGVTCLHILNESEAAPSWRTKAQLPPGRYRFEGRVRVSNVKPLRFGIHQGAGLRIIGQQRQSENLVGTSPWHLLTAEFHVDSADQSIELTCELRAASGEAWFDSKSLRLVREP